MNTIYFICMSADFKKYRKIPKISPGAYIFKGPFWWAHFWRGLCTKGNLRFEIDWASLLLGRKFTVFLCFILYLKAISKYKPPRGGLIFGGAIYRRVFVTLRVWGAYIWRGLFAEFYGTLAQWVDTWAPDTVRRYWSADTLFWQLSLITTMTYNVRLQVS